MNTRIRVSWFFALIVISLAICFIALQAEAAYVVSSGKCGSDLSYTVDNNGLLTISGTGDMSTWLYSYNIPWYYDNVKRVVIMPGVTSIGNYAFYSTDATEIIIPDTVTKIGKNAFEYCSQLKTLSIPDSVTSIGTDAFKNSLCYRDTTNYLNGVLYFGNHLIKAEASLMGVINIKDGTKTIYDSAFEGCTELLKVNIPDTVTSIGSRAFYGCTGLSGEIVIPEGVTEIKDLTFRECTSLSRITLPDGLVSIGDDAFYHCGDIESINIPKTLTNVGEYAFSGTWCYNVYITDLEAWCNISFINKHDSPMYDARGGFYLNDELIVDLIIPDGITTVNNSFCGTPDIRSVTFPDGVVKISADAFADCNWIKKVVIPASVTQIAGSAFTAENITVYGFLGSFAEDYAEAKGYSFVPLDDVTYTVKYDLNGGSGEIPDAQKGHDAPYTIIFDKPKMENARFAGWSIANDDKLYRAGDTYNGNNDVTFYVVWHPAIRVDNRIAALNSTFEVPVYIYNNCGLAGIGFEITYPDTLELLSVDKGAALESLDITLSNSLSANPIKAIFDGVDASHENGIVMLLTFRVKESAEEGAGELKIKVTDAHDNDMDDVIIDGIKANIILRSYIPGDVNGDKIVDLKDVTTIRRYLAGGYDITVNEPALDINRDGMVDLKDVTYLRRALAGGYGVELK